MSELSQAIDEMRTMRESYDQLSDAAVAYNEGKPALAAAITGKGVTTASTDSLTKMAENVEAISQQQITIDGGEMYAEQLFAKQVNNTLLWNLYDVLVQIQSNGTYAGYTGILLAEYFRGYDSIQLSGADAYLTCDGDYYTSGATHVWHDAENGKTNRWVAYFLGENGNVSGYTIPSTELCPRSIHIGGKVGTISCQVAGRVREVVVTDGNELGGLNFSSTQNWDKNVIIRNTKEHTSGYTIYNDSNVTFYLDETETITQTLVGGTCPNIYEIDLVSDGSISGSVLSGGLIVGTLAGLNRFVCNAKSVDPTGKLTNFGVQATSVNLKEILFPELLSGCFVDYDQPSKLKGLEKVIAPQWHTCISPDGYGWGTFNGAPALKLVKTNLSTWHWSGNVAFVFYCSNCIDVEVGALNQNTEGMFSNWFPTNALLTDSTSLLTQDDIDAGFTSNREKFLYNLREHIAKKIADRTGQTACTIYFSSDIKSAINDETGGATAAAFTNKNWTIG